MPTVARKAGTGAGAAMLASGMGRAQPAPKADHTARIAPTNLELVPGPKVRKEPAPCCGCGRAARTTLRCPD